MKGNPQIFDQWVLQSVLEGNFVDTKNTAYDYDVTDKFTWNFRELVKIKQKKRNFTRYYRPSGSVLVQGQNARKFDRAK